MSYLDDLVKINISATTATPTKPGFGTILIAAQKVPGAFVSRVRRFGSLKELTDFGFAVTDPAYLCAQKCKAQDPSIESFLVGKRVNKVTQTLQLTCTSAVVGDTYQITVGSTTYTRVVTLGATTTTEATAFAALIDAHASVTATATGAVITVTNTTAGELVNVKSWTDNLQLKDTTADGGSGGLAADLAAIKAATNQDWYGLALDSNSEAEINIAALFVETEKKIFVPNSSDWGCGDASTTTDVMSDMMTAGYTRTGVLWSRRELLSYSGAAWTAKQFAGAKPGEDTWAFKTLASVNVDELSAAEIAAIKGKNGNFYTQVSGINITQDGKSGAGEWLDIVRFIDWQRAEIQFRVFSAIVNNKKIPYSDNGIEALGAVVKSALQAGEDQGGLDVGSSKVVIPKVAGIPSATRATRKLSNVQFGGKLSGAIHQLELDGTFTP